MLRNRTATRLILVLTAIAALLLCVAVVSFVHRGIGSTQDTSAPPARFRLAWQGDFGTIRDAALSSNGRFLCTVSAEGLVTVYSSSKQRLYSCAVPGATKAIVTGDGRFAMAYSPLDASNPVLTFIDSRGRVYWTVQTGGAIWSADARGENGRATFAAGTGDRYVYIIELGRHRKHFRRWRTPGAVTSVALDAGGQEVIFGTWQRSMVARATLRGRRIWEMDTPATDLHQLDPLHLSNGVLVRSVPNKAGSDGEYALVDGRGEIVHQGPITAGERTRVLAAPSGRYVCVAREELIVHKGKSMREKHATILDSCGRKTGETGSLFFQADPLVVTRGGTALLDNGKGALFAMTPAGKLTLVAKLPGLIERAASSRDSSRVLILCRGGHACMIEVS